MQSYEKNETKEKNFKLFTDSESHKKKRLRTTLLKKKIIDVVTFKTNDGKVTVKWEKSLKTMPRDSEGHERERNLMTDKIMNNTVSGRKSQRNCFVTTKKQKKTGKKYVKRFQRTHFLIM